MTCARFLEEAEFADKYRKRYGALHPDWGNGSLTARAAKSMGWAEASPAFQSADFCAAVTVVLTALAEWRSCKSLRGGQANLLRSREKSENSP